MDSVAMVELSVLVGGKLCGLQSVMESKVIIILEGFCSMVCSGNCISFLLKA